MSEIERFNLKYTNCDDDPNYLIDAVLEPEANGEYVRYVDHERIVKELEAQRAWFEKQCGNLQEEVRSEASAVLSRSSLSDCIAAVEQMRRPASRSFLVRFLDHVEGSNCATWECQKCKGQWVSPGNLNCPHCHDNEAEPHVTEADVIYNRAVDDALTVLRSLSPSGAGERVAQTPYLAFITNEVTQMLQREHESYPDERKDSYEVLEDVLELLKPTCPVCCADRIAAGKAIAGELCPSCRVHKSHLAPRAATDAAGGGK